MANVPLIALLTDFGAADGYPGVMKGVILGIAPGIPLVDLTHEIPPQDVRAAAWVLHTSWRSFPEGSVFLCVVDPGVGSARHPLAFQAGKHIFVGPDNGLFIMCWPNRPPSAPSSSTIPRYFPTGASATFHGRDIFAPAAAWLAAGVAIEELGSALAASRSYGSRRHNPLGARYTGGALYTYRPLWEYTDRLHGARAQAIFSRAIGAPDHRGVIPSRRARAPSPRGQKSALFLYLDSSGYLAIARRNGSAAGDARAPKR